MRTVTSSVTGLEDLQQLGDPVRLARDREALMKKLAFQLLRYCIRTCSVDTGRARAGFLAYLDRHGIAADDVLSAPSPLQEGGSLSGVNAAAVALGRAEGSVVVDLPDHIEVVNAVEYVEYINAVMAGMMGPAGRSGTRFLDKALMRLLDQMDRVWDWYVNSRLAEAGFEPMNDPEEGPDMPTV